MTEGHYKDPRSIESGSQTPICQAKTKEVVFLFTCLKKTRQGSRSKQVFATDTNLTEAASCCKAANLITTNLYSIQSRPSCAKVRGCFFQNKHIFYHNKWLF